jgi:hypothetical protein
VAIYRIVPRAHGVDIVDAYGRCLDTVLEPGAWEGAPEPQPEATDSHLVDLVEQGERSGRYVPEDLQTYRTYDSTTGVWSTQLWPSSSC